MGLTLFSETPPRPRPQNLDLLSLELVTHIDRHLITIPAGESIAQRFFQQFPFHLTEDPLTIQNLNLFLQSLDRYTSYIPPQPKSITPLLEKETTHAMGTLLLPWENHVLMVPAKGGAAFHEGLEDAQFLRAIQGKKISDFNVDHVAAQIDNAFLHNRYVQFSFMHPISNQEMTLPLHQKDFFPAPVEINRITINPLYSVSSIRILKFTSHQTRDALEAAIAAITHTTHHLFLDLRYCLGGDYHEALDTASLFIPQGILMAKTLDKTGRFQYYHSIPGRKILNRPISILVGPHTASAGEVFAQIMADSAGNTSLVGAKTYGKCLSQRDFPLSNGGYLRLSNLQLFGADDSICKSATENPNIYIPPPRLFDTKEVIHTIMKSATPPIPPPHRKPAK
ncbi:MAG: hypothetical protein HQL75_17980 [Magnetococcales bacterium]|nr:hypothetical protein [Magnetococcales bacterium]